MREVVVGGGGGRLLARGSPERQQPPPHFPSIPPSPKPPHTPATLAFGPCQRCPPPGPRGGLRGRPPCPLCHSELVAASSHVRERLLASPSVWGRKSRRGLAGAGGARSRLPAAQTVGTRFNWPKTQQDGGTAALAEEEGGSEGGGSANVHWKQGGGDNRGGRDIG